jgi:hypothetical protein
MRDVQTSEVKAKLAPVNVGPLNFLCDDSSSEDEQLLERPLLCRTKNTNTAGGYNLNSHFVLCRQLMNRCI